MRFARLLQLATAALCCAGGAAFAEQRTDPPAGAQGEPIDPDVLRKVRKLIKGTLETDEKDREKAWTELRGMGNLVTPGLVELCKQKETTPAMMKSIMLALADSKDPRAGPALAGLLKSPDAPVRREAARAMGDCNYKSGLEQLEAMALNEKEDEEARLTAAVAATKMKSEKAGGVLKALLKSPKAEVRSRAVYALGKFGGIAQVDAIESALSDADDSVREDAVEALRLLGEKRAWAGLIKALKDENYKIRGNAMEALRQLTNAKVDPDPIAWQEWWDKHKDDAEPVKGEKKPKKEKLESF
ncbi:MAG TPA: HEAT repeat domain-containing protein [Planctomycetota bacterium]|nr:HEAT repeat domain-containing protein [Planctomycetota bacterium]